MMGMFANEYKTIIIIRGMGFKTTISLALFTHFKYFEKVVMIDKLINHNDYKYYIRNRFESFSGN